MRVGNVIYDRLQEQKAEQAEYEKQKRTADLNSSHRDRGELRVRNLAGRTATLPNARESECEVVVGRSEATGTAAVNVEADLNCGVLEPPSCRCPAGHRKIRLSHRREAFVQRPEETVDLYVLECPDCGCMKEIDAELAEQREFERIRIFGVEASGQLTILPPPRTKKASLTVVPKSDDDDPIIL